MHYLAPLDVALHGLQESLGSRRFAVLVVGIAVALVALLCVLLRLCLPKYITFITRNLRRSLRRTILSSVVVMVLAFVVTLVWSILVPLDAYMTEKTSDLKIIVSDRYQVPSQMPYAYATTLEEGAPEHSGDIRIQPANSMTWSFYLGTIDPEHTSFESFVFFFVLDPRSLLEQKIRDGTTVKTVPPMMGDLDHPDPTFVAAVHKMLPKTDDGKPNPDYDPQNVILGRDRLAALHKKVGERIKVTSLSHKGIDLDAQIVGVFPDMPRLNQAGAMSRDYLEKALDAYPQSHNGDKHPQAGKALNLVWLRVPDASASGKVANQIMGSPRYTDPYVKCDTEAAGTASFIEPYKDMLWGLKWILVPVLLGIMAMVMAMAISISVRERRTEMAVLKVLGYTPGRILAFVLGEAVLVGALSGFVIVALAVLVVQTLIGGVPFPIAWMAIWPIPPDALWWGPAFGAVTSFLGSLIPAWRAQSIKVSEVFAKVG